MMKNGVGTSFFGVASDQITKFKRTVHWKRLKISLLYLRSQIVNDHPHTTYNIDFIKVCLNLKAAYNHTYFISVFFNIPLKVFNSECYQNK